MPETSAMEVRRLRVSRRLLIAAAAVGVLIVLLTIASVVHSVVTWNEGEENATLLSENTTLKKKVTVLDERLHQVDETVGKLEKLDAKLRAMTMISDPERHIAMGPVGEVEESSSRSETNKPNLRKDLLGGGSRAMQLVENRLFSAEQGSKDILQSVSEISVFVENQKARLASTPSRRPCLGYASSRYGMRVDPFTGLPNMHAGIDFSANIGSPVVAPGDGVTIFSGNKGAYGKTIQIDHGDGLVSKYSHLSKIKVKVGDKVRRGQLIGDVGNTGRSTGPHLHYEIRINGVAVNPRRYILQ